MRVINLLICMFAISAFVQTIRSFSHRRRAIRSTILWLSIWLCIGVFGLFPHLVDLLMYSTMMTNRMYFLFVISILILYAFNFRQGSQNNDLARRLDRLTQEIAILQYQLKNAENSKGKSSNTGSID